MSVGEGIGASRPIEAPATALLDPLAPPHLAPDARRPTAAVTLLSAACPSGHVLTRTVTTSVRTATVAS
jgi:hypothetical protein